MYNLFLDDERFPQDVNWIELPQVKWIIARSYDDFARLIRENGLPDIVSLDHDLADEHYKEFMWAHDNKNLKKGNFDYSRCKEKTGMECAKFLVEYCMDNKLSLPSYYVHSMNYIGKDNIISYLESFKKSLTKV